MSTSAQTFVVPDLKDILFATDFSPCSEAVLPVLRSLALSSGSTVHVVHVVSPLLMTSMPQEMAPEFDAKYRDADEAAQALLATEAFSEVTCTSLVARGDAAEVIKQLAEHKHAGLIVLGTHGRRGLKKLVLGSTAEAIIRTAPCPVLTVGPEAGHHALGQASLGPMVVAIDLETGAHPALRFAASLARANHVRLILLYAVPPSLEAPAANLDSIPFMPTFSAELTARALASSQRRIEEMIAVEQVQSLNPQVVVEVALAADLIVRTAEASQAGMIIMGAHQTGVPAMTSHFPGQTASVVLCEAPCPVMTIRD
jgi:nucleotide-binding universal stress UspA family protein